MSHSLCEITPNTATFHDDSAQKYLVEMYMLGKLPFSLSFGPSVFAGHVRSCKYRLGSRPAGTGLLYTQAVLILSVCPFFISLFI